MISRRRARETPRIYSSCIRTHTRVLHINRCIYIYTCVTLPAIRRRRRRVLQFRSSPFSSLLFSFLSPSPSTSPSLTPITNPNFIPFFPFHASRSLSLSLVSRSSYLIVSFYPIGTRARIRRISLSLFLSFYPRSLSLSLSQLLLPFR